MAKTRDLMNRLTAYLARWRMSTPILAIFTYVLADYGAIVSSIMANLIGGLIFYKVDKRIFKKK